MLGLDPESSSIHPQRVHVNKTTTVVLPDRDVALGAFEPGDRLVSRERRTQAGLTADVEKVRAT